MEGLDIEEISLKSRLVATLLTAFLGMFGAHRFYIGKIRTALAMLIVTITCLATVRLVQPPFNIIIPIILLIIFLWVLVDFIYTASGIMKDKHGKIIMHW